MLGVNFYRGKVLISPLTEATNLLCSIWYLFSSRYKISRDIRSNLCMVLIFFCSPQAHTRTDGNPHYMAQPVHYAQYEGQQQQQQQQHSNVQRWMLTQGYLWPRVRDLLRLPQCKQIDAGRTELRLMEEFIAWKCCRSLLYSSCR